LGDFRKVDNDASVVVADQLIEGQLQLLAFDAHLEGPLNSRMMMPGFSSFLLISKGTYRFATGFQSRSHDFSSALDRWEIHQAPGAPLRGAVSPS